MLVLKKFFKLAEINLLVNREVGFELICSWDKSIVAGDM